MTYSRLVLHGTCVFHLCTRDFPFMLPVNTPSYYCILDFYASKPVNPFVFVTVVTIAHDYRFAFAIVVTATREYVLYM